MASKVKHESRAVRVAIESAIADTRKASESASKSHARMVHELAGLMNGGTSVGAVKDEVKSANADKLIGFCVSYAQFIPLMSRALRLSGAPVDVFGKTGAATLFGRGAQSWKASGAGESFAKDMDSIVSGASAWSEVAEKLQSAIDGKPKREPKVTAPGEVGAVKVGAVDDLEPEQLAELLTVSAVATWLAHLVATGYKPSAHEAGGLKNIAQAATALGRAK